MRTIITLAAGAALFTSLPAQLTVGGIPYALRTGLDASLVPTLGAAEFDATAAAVEDAQRAVEGNLPLYSRHQAVNATPQNSGLWDVLPNGDRVWRLRLESKNALATELYFDQFHLPPNAILHVYDDEGGQLQGGFTAYNNKEHGQFTTGLINGDASIVEYYEPQNVSGQGGFRITHVGHAYRFMGEAKADDCEVDVKCSEGNNWWQQRNGVVRLSVVDGGASGWCTGSVVNNVLQDCKPYILSAFHCGVGSSTSDFNLYKAYFKYQRSGCGTGTAPAGSYMTGCVKRADSNDGGGNSGSDFMLIEMSDTIPNNFNPYFNGWSANTTASPNGVGIHHPAGSEKKISTYTSNTVTDGWGIAGTHWRVTWVTTANGWGVTEGGSSGSPLFNNSGLIIGTLTGGASYCNSVQPGANDDPDYYGKMSYHWNDNPGSATEHLEEWLDPNGAGALTLAGSADPCGYYSFYLGEGGQQETQTAPEMFPNPAVDEINIVVPEGVADVQRLEVMDLTGRRVCTLTPASSEVLTIDTEGWAAGTYIIQLVADGITYGGVRVTVTAR